MLLALLLKRRRVVLHADLTMLARSAWLLPERGRSIGGLAATGAAAAPHCRPFGLSPSTPHNQIQHDEYEDHDYDGG
jgi:hypothetical protein